MSDHHSKALEWIELHARDGVQLVAQALASTRGADGVAEHPERLHSERLIDQVLQSMAAGEMVVIQAETMSAASWLHHALTVEGEERGIDTSGCEVGFGGEPRHLDGTVRRLGAPVLAWVDPYWGDNAARRDAIAAFRACKGVVLKELGP